MVVSHFGLVLNRVFKGGQAGLYKVFSFRTVEIVVVNFDGKNVENVS